MKKLIKLLLILVLISSLHITLYTLHSYAAVPHLINYQGRLTDKENKPLEGAYNLTFRIYDDENAGNLLWQETYQNINIQKGIFSVMLGSITNLDLPFDKSYWLEIKVNNEVMSPRQRIASSGYAFMAENTLSIPRGVIVMWSGRILDIPSGWALCDGTKGTPDLRDKFVVGARQDDGGVAKTEVTGSLTQSGDGIIPTHTHRAGTLTAESAGVHAHEVYSVELQAGGSYQGFGDSAPTGTQKSFRGIAVSSSAGAHNHSLSGSTETAGSASKNVAVYYALAFIMKL